MKHCGNFMRLALTIFVGIFVTKKVATGAEFEHMEAEYLYKTTLMELINTEYSIWMEQQSKRAKEIGMEVREVDVIKLKDHLAAKAQYTSRCLDKAIDQSSDRSMSHINSLLIDCFKKWPEIVATKERYSKTDVGEFKKSEAQLCFIKAQLYQSQVPRYKFLEVDQRGMAPVFDYIDYIDCMGSLLRRKGPY